ncbi:23S rRNA (guanosine-2'-O-)-methyltransferase RlmB [Arenicella chitinivorans]|uniref:23S rRNA (Guanosine-2'-O-)-methyltransferase RlmB n=1 Tax=Arenicella chitinivorans TaxID=1329800 RepID=A0A918VTF2_9GAMM|nr:23S rRNA (guanosine(2251)-2'-O)-methyltransferase RlmB [Arenicella chitinivorans]GHA21598.1 23S rRNA (guanosine-2'-O-)-methyltransferase RlmB [Arenicella chitinivorans]
MSQQQSWVIGHHAVSAVLRVNPERAIELWVVINPSNQVQADILTQASTIGLSIHPVDRATLDRRCGSPQHQGVALLARPRAVGGDKDLRHFIEQQPAAKPALLLILDHVQDPHNFGACLRTADAAGVDAVVVAKDNASPITSVVQKVASGAAETMPIFRVPNLARSMDMLKRAGLWMIGTSDKADHDLYQQDLTGAIAIVMGAEGKGLRKLTAEKCDCLVSLPMAGSVVSSLNVSVATGVCLYEAVRQRCQV